MERVGMREKEKVRESSRARERVRVKEKVRVSMKKEKKRAKTHQTLHHPILQAKVQKVLPQDYPLHRLLKTSLSNLERMSIPTEGFGVWGLGFGVWGLGFG